MKWYDSFRRTCGRCSKEDNGPLNFNISFNRGMVTVVTVVYVLLLYYCKYFASLLLTWSSIKVVIII
jgi:hypothetical protein